jgi:hypothetical protein
MNEQYYIKDLGKFVESTRRLVYNHFGSTEDSLSELLDEIKPEEQDEFDTILSQEESIVIVKSILKKQINRKTKETRYIVNDDIFQEVVSCLNDRMVSNLLNSLVNRGILETGFDDESQEFVFWIKDENK